MNRAGCCDFSGKGISAGGGITPRYSGRAELFLRFFFRYGIMFYYYNRDWWSIIQMRKIIQVEHLF